MRGSAGAAGFSPESRARLDAQQEANRIDHIDTALAYAQVVCYLDRGNTDRALDLMIDVREMQPDSQLFGQTFQILQNEAANRVGNRASQRVRRGLGGLGSLGRAIDRNIDRPDQADGC